MASRVSMERRSRWPSCLTNLEYSNCCYAAEIFCLQAFGCLTLACRVKSDNRWDCRLTQYMMSFQICQLLAAVNALRMSPLTWYRRYVVNTNTLLAQCPSNLLQPNQPRWQRAQCGEGTRRAVAKNKHALALPSSKLLFPCGHQICRLVSVLWLFFSFFAHS